MNPNLITIILISLSLICTSCNKSGAALPFKNEKGILPVQEIAPAKNNRYQANLLKFQKLRADWEHEYQQYLPSSDTRAFWKGVAGQAIISMDKAAIPFLIEELQNGNFFFNIPLDRITGISMKGSSEQDRMRGWVDWWLKNKSNPIWNVYLP